MRVFLVIDRAKAAPGIWALLWTADPDDPRLLESKHFLGEAALQVWLAGIATRYGPTNIAVDWTDSLRADDRLATVLKKSLGPGAAGA
jgi:hypothetical protein